MKARQAKTFQYVILFIVAIPDIEKLKKKKNTARDKFNEASWTSVSWVLVVQVQNLLVLVEWTSERFCPD